MFPESKVTEIYCMADDFCKEFTLQQEKYMIKDMKTMHRNKPNRMSDAEIMVILILFHSGGFRCFKHYYKEYVCKHLKHLFPRQVSYNRFVELEKEVLLPMTIFIKRVLLGTCTTAGTAGGTPPDGSPERQTGTSRRYAENGQLVRHAGQSGGGRTR